MPARIRSDRTGSVFVFSIKFDLSFNDSIFAEWSSRHSTTTISTCTSRHVLYIGPAASCTHYLFVQKILLSDGSVGIAGRRARALYGNDHEGGVKL